MALHLHSHNIHGVIFDYGKVTALIYMRYVVLTALLLKMLIFGDVMLFLVLQFLMLQTIMTPSL